MTQRAATISKTTGVALGLVIPLVTGAFWLASERGDVRGRVDGIEKHNTDQDETIRQLAATVEALRQESKDCAAWRARVETDIGYIRRALERSDRVDRSRKPEGES